MSNRGEVHAALLTGLGGILALLVPFLPWSEGTTTDGSEFSYNAFQLRRLGIDVRILAYPILGVGVMATVTALARLLGFSRGGILGTVVASGAALVITIMMLVGLGFAQFFGLSGLLGSNADYSFPTAVIGLGISTGVMLAGMVLRLKKRRRHQVPDMKT